MNQKQYETMTTIMGFGRVFADQIHKCMENAGLLDKGFEFRVFVENGKYYESGADYLVVQLQQSISRAENKDEYYATRMEQTKSGRKGWLVLNDPIAETCDVPPVVESRKAEENDGEGTGEDGGKPYPPYDMWISACDDYPDVDGGQ